MSRKRETKRAPKATIVKTGYVLFFKNEEDSDERDLFIVISMTGSSVALLKIFEPGDMNDTILKKCYLLQFPISYLDDIQQPSLPLHVDTSKVHVEYTISFLQEHESVIVAGNIHPTDMEMIQHSLMRSNTVPNNIKAIFYADDDIA